MLAAYGDLPEASCARCSAPALSTLTEQKGTLSSTG